MSEIQGIHVYRGTALSSKDYLSESDAYFVCRIGSIGSSWSEKAYESDGYEIRSQTVDNSSNPEWNAFFSFNLAKDLVHLSMLFKLYHSDFGSNKGEILQWIHDQFPESAEKLKQLDGLFEKIGKDNVKIKNVTYDWGHNKKD